MATATRSDDGQVIQCPECQSTFVLVRGSRARLTLMEASIVSILGIALISISVTVVLLFQTINGDVITRIDNLDQQIGTINQTVNGNVSTEIEHLSQAISGDVTTQIRDMRQTLNSYVASQSLAQATPGPLQLTTSCSSDPSGSHFFSISSCPVTVRVETAEGPTEEIVLGDESSVNKGALPDRYLVLSAVRPGYQKASVNVPLARQTVGQVVTIRLERLP